MLDDGSKIFLANYVYIYSLYAQTMFFSIGSALTVQFNFAPYPKPTVGAYDYRLLGLTPTTIPTENFVMVDVSNGC